MRMSGIEFSDPNGSVIRVSIVDRSVHFEGERDTRSPISYSFDLSLEDAQKLCGLLQCFLDRHGISCPPPE